MSITEEIKKIIGEEITKSGFILDDVLFEKEGSTKFLRIIIDKENHVEVDDCVTVSRLISPILDEHDLIKESYILDVCSKEKGE